MKDQLLQRIRPGVPYHAYFKAGIESAFNLVERFEAERDRIKADGRFSEQGKRETIAVLVNETLVPELVANAARIARHASARLQSRKTALGRPAFDKSDMASALERREIRDYVRSQPEGQRMTVALGLLKERHLAEAVLSGPTASLTGLNGEQFATLHREYLKTYHGDELAEIEAERQDIEAVNAAATIARKALQDASGKPAHEFEKVWAMNEEKVDG